MQDGTPLPLPPVGEIRDLFLQKETLLFGQGGYDLFQMLGILQVLKINKIYPSFKWVVSPSSTALAGLVACANVYPRDVSEYLIELYSNKKILVPNLSVLFQKGSISDNKAIAEIVDSVLAFVLLKTEFEKIVEINFEQFYKLNKTNLIIVLTDYHNNDEIIYFSRITTPQVSIREALIGSLCLPFIWLPSPVRFGPEKYKFINSSASTSDYVIDIFNPKSRLYIGEGLKTKIDFPTLTPENTLIIESLSRKDFESIGLTKPKFNGPIKTMNDIIVSVVYQGKFIPTSFIPSIIRIEKQDSNVIFIEGLTRKRIIQDFNFGVETAIKSINNYTQSNGRNLTY